MGLRVGIDMATEGDVELELETETSGPERPPEKPRKHDSGAADLERVTDYAEEKVGRAAYLGWMRADGARRPTLQAWFQEGPASRRWEEARGKLNRHWAPPLDGDGV